MVIIERSRLISIDLSKTYIKVRIDKYPSHIFTIQSSLRQEIPFQGSLLTIGPIRCPEMLLQNYHSNLHKITKQKRGDVIYIAAETRNSEWFQVTG